MNIWKSLLLFWVVLCPSGLFAAATLTVSEIGEESAFLFGDNAPMSSTPCQFLLTIAEQPLGCEVGEANGAHYTVHFTSSVTNSGKFVQTFNNSITFFGDLMAKISPGTTSLATVSYHAFIVIGPQVPGDTFSFTLQQRKTCQNSLAKCHANDVRVVGASSTKGKLETGLKIVSSKPVVIAVDEAIGVGDPILSTQEMGAGTPFGSDDPVTSWTVTQDLVLTITPRKEASQPALLDDDDN